MNLNYSYDRASLKALTQTADSKLDVHTLVIDFDGEVVLDPEVHFPGVPVDKYKFCTQIEDKSLRDDVSLASLYDALDEIYIGQAYAEHKHNIGGKNNGKIAA